MSDVCFPLAIGAQRTCYGSRESDAIDPKAGVTTYGTVIVKSMLMPKAPQAEGDDDALEKGIF
jgi:hypothetical protein